MSEPMQIPVELEVEAVKRYVMGEALTPYNFDLLQNYFEGRIIKLLIENLATGLSSDGKFRTIDFIDIEWLIELIKGNK